MAYVLYLFLCRLTYSKMEQYELAVECYEKALELDPNNTGYQNNMKIAKDKIKERQANPAVGFIIDKYSIQKLSFSDF